MIYNSVTPGIINEDDQKEYIPASEHEEDDEDLTPIQPIANKDLVQIQIMRNSCLDSLEGLQKEDFYSTLKNEADPVKKSAKKAKVAAKKAGKKSASKGKKGAKKGGKKSASKGKKGKKGGKKGKKGPKRSITGIAPSGQIAKGYDAPEKINQPDPKLLKWGTTFYAEQKWKQ